MKTFNTKYTAAIYGKSSLKVTAPELPIDLHQMIVWVMYHQEDAVHLLPAYREIRQQAILRDEAQKTHCGQDI
jgi:hypothetical protein